MSPYDVGLYLAVFSVVFTAYAAYWLGWCWVMHFVWPAGPEWFVRPSIGAFLIVNITALIITLAILSRSP